MKNISNRTMLGIAVGWAAVVMAVTASPSAADEEMKPGPSASRTTHQSMVVKKVDHKDRTVTLQASDGSTKTVEVPSDVQGFDSIKKGDRVDVDYHEAMALSMLPAGTKPSMTEKTTKMRPESGTAATAREITASAVIVSVDAANNQITFKGPKGQTRTVTVDDPAMQQRLPSLKPGQVVQLTYTEAVAASITPSGSGSMK